MRRLSLVATFVFAVLSVSACGSDSTGPSVQTPTGTWSLQTVNGSALPFVLAQTGANKVELISDVFVISGTGSFTETASIRSTTNGVPTTQSTADAGSYTVSGSAVVLHFNSDNSTATGSWSGNTITIAGDGFALAYKR